MEIRILGPLEVLEEGRPIAVGGARQRALLAVLATRPNQVVSTDRLVEELWGEDPPEGAANALQAAVSRLRRALEAGVDNGARRPRVLTRPPGYVLEVDPEVIDAARFERLAAEGRRALAGGDPRKASSLLGRALGLWRGPALAEFSYDPFAQTEIARLEELRLEATEDRMEAELACDRHAMVVGELEALVTRRPFRERLRGQLMVALYRSGRQAEALEAYRQGRDTLAEELGIDPTPELTGLQARILRQDPALLAARPPPAVLTVEPPIPGQSDIGDPMGPSPRGSGPGGPDGAPFVGRDREMADLLSGVGSAVSGRGRLFLIAGEPGIGKSRLADELAWHAEQRGMRVLWGRCWEAGGAPAYWPWVQSIRSYIRGVEASAVKAQLGAGGPHIARLLPEVRELVPALPEPPGPDVEGDRFLLFDAIAQFLRAAADVKPIVLVLDDLHAADPSSLLLLEFVAGETAAAPILLLALYRDTDLQRTHPLRPALSGLSRYRWTRQLALRGLTEPDVARYIEAATGLVPGQTLISAVHEETEGNPLFVGELVRLLADEGRLASAGDDGSFRLAVPEGVREVIGRRLGRLSDRCREVLLVASVPGREFSLEVLQALTDLSPEALLRQLDEAREARVVHEVPGGLGRWRFAHALIRDTLYDDLTTVRRLRLHRKVGEALETRYRNDLEPHTAELAHHFFEAASAGEAERAVQYAERAGARAAKLLAYEEAVRLNRMALLALDRTGSAKAQDRCRLLLALGDAQARGGDPDQAKETFLQAAEEARKATSPELVAAAALGYGGRFVWARAGDDRRLVSLLEDALAVSGEEDGPRRARLLARLAGALRDHPDRGLAAKLSRQAVEMARRLGDPATLAYALDGLYAALWWPENPEERLGIATELVEVAREAGDAERLAEGLDYRICALMELGDVAAADADLATMDGLVGQLRQPAQRWVLLHTRACRALFDGRFGEAEQLIAEALSAGERAQRWDAVMSFRLQTFLLRREQGRVLEVEELIRHSIAEYPTRPVFRCVLAHLYAELGRWQEAHSMFEALAVDDFAGLPRDNDWVLGLSLLPEVAGFLQDGARAAVLYDMLLPYAGRLPMWGAEISTGSASRGLGNLASATSRWDAAVLHFEEALEMNERTGARPWVAHTCHDHARMLLARDRPRDRAHVAELLERARGTCQEVGMVALGAKVSALVDEHGLRPRLASRAPVASSTSREIARPGIFRREGEYWSIGFEGDEFRLRNSKGLQYLAELLARPGREVFALDLAAGRGGGDRGTPVEPGLSVSRDLGDAGEVIDREARLAYRRRIEELQLEIEAAEGWHDGERAARAKEELDFLATELASATGLGGRGRRVGSAAERARVNVTRAIRAAMIRIREHSLTLGDHLSRTIRTGTFCAYEPDPRFPSRWRT